MASLNHLYAMDLVWQAHLENRSHGFSTRRPKLFDTLSELGAAQVAIDRWYIDYAAQLEPESANTVVEFEFIGGGHGAMTRCEILIHVVNHATYHRGHITDAMLQIPARPPVTDFPVFIRERSGTDAP